MEEACAIHLEIFPLLLLTKLAVCNNASRFDVGGCDNDFETGDPANNYVEINESDGEIQFINYFQDEEEIDFSDSKDNAASIRLASLPPLRSIE